jgi:nucleotide-binding universal stress UspA family protein
MAPQGDGSAVVVGVDGSLAARRAVRLAAQEAALRGLPLRIVTATPWPDLHEGAGPAAERERLRALADADAALAEAAELAQEILAPRRIHSVTAVGWPAAVLVEESRQAELVVVGNRGRGGFAGLLLGSVGVEVSAHARCPVLVVHQPPAGARTPGPGAPVIVGVDGGRLAREVTAAAFQEAELHAAPLVAVHTWNAPVLVGAGQLPPTIFEQVHRPADEAERLAEVLAPHRARHPGVEVVERVAEGRAAEVLVAESADAGMLVVGSRGRGAFAGLMLGSVSQAAIHHAECPVLVVRSSGAKRAGG